MDTQEGKYQVVLIEYLPNYKVKFTCMRRQIQVDEGGGWYSIGGYEQTCYASRIKHSNQIPSKISTIEQLTQENKKLFEDARKEFEESRQHKEWMKQFTKSYINSKQQ